MSSQSRGEGKNKTCKNCGRSIGHMTKRAIFCSKLCRDKWVRYNSKVTREEIQKQHEEFDWETVEARVKAGESFKHVVYDMGAYRPNSAYNYWKRNRGGFVGRNSKAVLTPEQFDEGVKLVLTGSTVVDAAKKIGCKEDTLRKRLKRAGIRPKPWVQPTTRPEADRIMKRTREAARKKGVKRVSKRASNVVGRMERTMRNHREDIYAAGFLDNVIDGITRSIEEDWRWPSGDEKPPPGIQSH